MTTTQLAAQISNRHAALVTAENQLLMLAAAWADHHDLTGQPDHGPLIERACQLGGPGTLEVSEFCSAEFGALTGVGMVAGRAMIADALDLRHRLPRLWERITHAQVRAWKARKIADATRHLDYQAARDVDTAVIDYVDTLPWPRLVKVLDAAIVDADPDLAAEREAQARTRREVYRTRSVDGLTTIIARATTGDAVVFMAMINRIADLLAADDRAAGRTPEPVDIRRSRAIGILARPADTLTLLLDHRHDPHPPGDPDIEVAAPSSDDRHPFPDPTDDDVPDEPDLPDLPDHRPDGRDGLTPFTDAVAYIGAPAARPPDRDGSQINVRVNPDAGLDPSGGHEVDSPSDADSQTGTSSALDDPLDPDRSADRDELLNSEPPPDPGHPDAPGEDSALRDFSDLTGPLTMELLRRAARATGPRIVLHYHLSATTIRDGHGLTRPADHTDPISLAALHTWLSDTGCPVTVQPVLDPATIAPVDRYEVPLRMRAALAVRDLADTFPYGSLHTRIDHDHTQPFNPHGPPGQTRLDNLAPLSRSSHRATTIGHWSRRQPDPGLHLWRSPHGWIWLVTHQGTYNFGNTAYSHAFWRAAEPAAHDHASAVAA